MRVQPRASAPLSGRLVRAKRRPEDTPDGCRIHAAADLARAEASDGDPWRWRMEHSAAAWTARAELLDSHEADLRLHRIHALATRSAHRSEERYRIAKGKS